MIINLQEFYSYGKYKQQVSTLTNFGIAFRDDTLHTYEVKLIQNLQVP